MSKICKTFDPINIVSLIEKDTSIRLIRPYKNVLLTKIQNTFTADEQQLFVASFYCYLNYESKTDFIIDFTNVWKWCGFTRKDNAKTLLEKFFTENIDYKVEKAAPAIAGAAIDPENHIEKTAPQVGGAAIDPVNQPGIKRSGKNKGGAGLNKEHILLTINCFKKFCMKTGTKKADQIHDYYIKLEELLQETLQEQTNELQLQLEEKTKALEETEQLVEEKDKKIKTLQNKYCSQQPRHDIEEKNVIYIITSRYHQKERIYIIGKAIKLKERLSCYNKDVEHEIIYYKNCNSACQMALIERMVLMKLAKYREVANRDRFILPIGQEISLFVNAIDTAIKYFEDVDASVDIDKDLSEEERIAQYKKEYAEDHKEQIYIVQKQWREENKEQIALTKKQYHEENRDEILFKHKQYYEENKEAFKKYAEENKEKISERMKEWREDRKNEIKEYNAKYREENKEQLEEKRKNFYTEKREEILAKKKEKVTCICGLVLTSGCLSKHMKSNTHKYAMNAKNKEESQ